MRPAPPPDRKASAQQAFSLIELLIALAILAILAAVAVPAWSQYLERGWRTQARAELVAAMLELEQHALAAATFALQPGSDIAAGNWPRPVPPGPNPRHVLTAAACPHAGLDACVEIRATPVAPDHRCGVLILRSTGQQLNLPGGTAHATQSESDC
ncbi:prepilin-type N-terminal cleavage/methylation domain-containing protein [Cupriavidus sp. WKF15]|uniref:prepilin-type N-terminal cleavage/methylation domain-containing protein n=1 Tax=Cupriavidus sp. WKF15 TaxID=3032282 RepID=UPI0023E13CA6|nr:prepilin-type N-terminal cleavage/methylation domain-containing protein [Cupriavidus sp. WKF15]WER45116.1 prepilin-type N-terminal cleavage/methylation domain-containing protein [Cupriavidus sp. WKF15]